MSYKDYISEECNVSTLSELKPEEAEALVGKTIKEVYAGEYFIGLVLSDNSELYVNGSTYGDCALEVVYSGNG